MDNLEAAFYFRLLDDNIDDHHKREFGRISLKKAASLARHINRGDWDSACVIAEEMRSKALTDLFCIRGRVARNQLVGNLAIKSSQLIFSSLTEVSNALEDNSARQELEKELAKRSISIEKIENRVKETKLKKY